MPCRYRNCRTQARIAPWIVTCVLGLIAPLATATPPVLQLRGATLTVMEPHSGAVRWRFQGKAGLFEPVLHCELLLITGRSGTLLALEAGDGRLRWRLTTGDDWIYPPLPLAGRLVVAARNSGLYGLDPADGRILWHRPLSQEPTYRPVALDDRRALVALFDGELSARDAGDGHVIWRTRLDTPALHLAVGHGLAIFGGYDDRLRAVDMSDGSFLWRRPLPGRVALPPSIRAGAIVVTTDERRRVVLDPGSGTLLREWRLPPADGKKDVPVPVPLTANEITQ